MADGTVDVTIKINEKLLEKIRRLASLDVALVVEKDAQYGSSWKKRGGVGAFMMLARKWDRIENFARNHGYDIFEAIEKNHSLVEDMMDLGCYLWLVRSEGLVLDDTDTPDTYCSSTPDGDCTSEDPRCMHQPQTDEPGRERDPRERLENPYAYTPDEIRSTTRFETTSGSDFEVSPGAGSDFEVNKTPKFFSIGDTELRGLYELDERKWMWLPANRRVDLICELRAHYACMRMNHRPPRSLQSISNEYGVSLREPFGDLICHPRKEEGETS